MAGLLRGVLAALGGGVDVGSKAEVRARVRTARDAEPEERRYEADARICAQLLASAEWKAAPLVLTYLSCGSEVDTRQIIEEAWAQGKRVALPRCVPATHELAWVEVTSFEGLVAGAHGIKEPVADAPTLNLGELPDTTLALVPGLLFDASCQRLGYGGGYYDRFLPTFGGFAVGLCRSGQFVESLETLGLVESHDVAVDKVIFPKATAQDLFAR